MSFKIQLVKTEDDYQRILAVRRKVFIEEQNVSEEIEIEHEKAVSYTHLRAHET